MRPSLVPLGCAVLGALACHQGPAGPLGSALPMVSAAAIVEGRANGVAPTDTVDGNMSIGLQRARWTLRSAPTEKDGDFWSDVALLDTPSAERAATSMEERTFAAALRTLMDGQPEAAAVAFEVLHGTANDSLVRSRARVGLTMALSYHSDWGAMARLRTVAEANDSASSSLALAAGVERWARALSIVPPSVFDIPSGEVILPMRRSFLGTPVVTIRINGKPHDFWLDTGASMTLLSTDVAIAAGAKLAANDTLALGVVGGHIEARAIYIDSMSLGSIVVRGLGAALVSPEALRFDERTINGVKRTVPIDGMIGTDVLRHLDVVIDARAGTITLSRPRRRNVSTRNLFWVGYPVVRLVTRDGRPVLFGLDTGAEGTYVTTTLLKKLPRTPVAARRNSLVGLGASQQGVSLSKKSSWVARDVPLSDGNYAITLRNVPVMPSQRWTFVDFDGVIGSDIALATRMHLDFTNGVFDIRASAAAEPPLGAGPDVKVGH
ncbi:MAG: retropepsin-like aspartic protease [Gemmatimonadaceae bacterium]